MILATAQNDRYAELGIIDKIPFTVHADVFLDSLLPDKTIGILSESLRIEATNFARTLTRYRIMVLGEPADILSLSHLEYRTSVNHNWKRFPKDTVSINLIDQRLQIGQTLTLEFRNPHTQQSIQRVRFKRYDLLPVIAGYKIQQVTDSSTIRIATAKFTRVQPLYPGFQKLVKRELIMEAGKHLLIQLKRVNENRDSCLLYRLRNKEGNVVKDWVSAGHLIQVIGLDGDEKYFFDVKYKQADKVLTCLIRTLPYWHQLVWVRILAGCMFIIVTISTRKFLIKRKAKKLSEKRARAKTQLSLVRHRLGPHWTFNSLNSLSGLFGRNEIEMAREYLNSFSILLRDSLDRSIDDLRPLAEDIAYMEHFMILEQIKKKFRFNIQIDPTLNLEEIEFPPVLLQPTLENAVKHGISTQSNGGVINLIYKAERKDLLVSITDNGQVINKQKQKGHGTEITQNWIRHLQEINPAIEIHYSMIHTAKGTLVQFRFINWLATE